MVSLTPTTDAIRKLYKKVRAVPPTSESPDAVRVHNLTIDLTEALQLHLAAGQDEGRDINEALDEAANSLSNALFSVAVSHTDNLANASHFCMTVWNTVALMTQKTIATGGVNMIGYQEVEEESQHPAGRA